MAKQTGLSAAATALRKKAMKYPEVVEEFPWEHSAFKIKRKVFLFLFHGVWKEREMLSATMKLPQSHLAAVSLPFAQPAGYGLGKTGWVTCQFFPGDLVPLDMLSAWLDESFRAIAPAKVLAQLDGKTKASQPSKTAPQRKPRKPKDT